MAQNTPAKRPDIQRVSVAAAAETTVTFPGVVTLIGFTLQALEDVNLYFSFDLGGTFSADNYYTLKAGYIWNERDINYTPPEDVLYLRSAAGTITAELIYWG